MQALRIQKIVEVNLRSGRLHLLPSARRLWQPAIHVTKTQLKFKTRQFSTRNSTNSTEQKTMENPVTKSVQQMGHYFSTEEIFCHKAAALDRRMVLAKIRGKKGDNQTVNRHKTGKTSFT